MSQDQATEKAPIINCHTHVFIGENIPPQIGKTFIWWPFYNFFTIPAILCLCRFWYLNKWSPSKFKYTGTYKSLKTTFYNCKMFVARTALRYISALLSILIVYHAVIFILKFLDKSPIKPDGNLPDACKKTIKWLQDHSLFYDPTSSFIKIAIVTFAILFIKSGRQIIVFIAKKAWSFLSLIPDKKTLQFVARYINIGRFAYYESSFTTFKKLKDQYPAKTGFILLPMDMEFMDAGEIKEAGKFGKQMDELWHIKKDNLEIAFPFVFIDPRRKNVESFIDKDENPVPDTPFLKWQKDENKPGRVVLLDCFIKDYIEEKKFNGFKIYPALGYYPFDEELLALWKYAADNSIPITTHCIRGTIFYRGKKDKMWDFHPVFQEGRSGGIFCPLLLPEIKNVDFINNFTHPLNYLCLLEERLLRIIIGKADEKIKELFGYNGQDIPMNHNLSKLKLCFGHYGGDDEWARYFEKDRDNRTKDIIQHPTTGIKFCNGTSLDPIESSFVILEQIWKYSDWYTIISSMMLQFENVYSDISYIIHNDAIVPLLQSTLQNPDLRNKVLLGTDFFVVRNHKSDKEMLADIECNLDKDDFDVIARDNPKLFLTHTHSVL